MIIFILKKLVIFTWKTIKKRDFYSDFYWKHYFRDKKSALRRVELRL